jgi:hypothetical protein
VGVAQDLAQEALVGTWQQWRRVHDLERPWAWSKRSGRAVRRPTNRRTDSRPWCPGTSLTLRSVPAALETDYNHGL